jgi:hypothetical protein
MNLDNITSVGGGGITAMVLTVNTLSIYNAGVVLLYGAIGGLGGWLAKELAKYIRKKVIESYQKYMR